MSRKTPVLLRRGPVTGSIQALTRYTTRHDTAGDQIHAAIDGKHDVTADFDALVLEHLLDPDAGDICAQLDGAARGIDLTHTDRYEIAAFRSRLIALIERHNTTGHGRKVKS